METDNDSLEQSKREDISETRPQDGDKKLQRSQTEESIRYPSGMKLGLIMISLYMAMFLVALDRTIIATAIPRITDHFNSIDDIGWYGSAYLLTACGFILVYGRLYTFYSTKWTFLSGIILFEAGSALCGAAPSSNALIVGRAIAGFGSSGIMTGAIMIMVQSLPLHKRPMYQGLFGAVFGVASVAGPLLGGAFTDSKASWRWCFYINLPIGGFTIIVLTLILNLDEKKKKEASLWEQFKALDPLGTLFFVPSIVCLLLALQWGGVTYEWGEWRIIVLLVFFGVLFICFVAVQYYTRHTTAQIPARIIKNRSIISGCFFVFCVGGCMMAEVYYLPLWFQAIKGASAIKSGIMTLPLILSLVVASIICGAIVQRLGYYTPFLYIGATLCSIGAGLLTTFTTTTGHSTWIGYQCLLGFGIGSSFQQANLAAQRVLPHHDVPTGSSLVFFFQTFGGTVFISVGQNVFLDKLVAKLTSVTAGAIDPRMITQTGATQLRHVVPQAQLGTVLEAYNWALMHGPMVVAVIIACLTIFGALGMEWLSVKDKPGSGKGGAEKKKVVDEEKGAETGAEKTVEAALQSPEPIPQVAEIPHDQELPSTSSTPDKLERDIEK